MARGTPEAPDARSRREGGKKNPDANRREKKERADVPVERRFKENVDQAEQAVRKIRQRSEQLGRLGRRRALQNSDRSQDARIAGRARRSRRNAPVERAEIRRAEPVNTQERPVTLERVITPAPVIPDAPAKPVVIEAKPAPAEKPARIDLPKDAALDAPVTKADRQPAPASEKVEKRSRPLPVAEDREPVAKPLPAKEQTEAEKTEERGGVLLNAVRDAIAQGRPAIAEVDALTQFLNELPQSPEGQRIASIVQSRSSGYTSDTVKKEKVFIDIRKSGVRWEVVLQRGEPKATESVKKEPEKKPEQKDAIKERYQLNTVLQTIGIGLYNELDNDIVGDFDEIRYGLVRIGRLKENLTKDEQAALRLVTLTILPKGVSSSCDGLGLNLDVTEPDSALKLVLSRELRTPIFMCKFSESMPSGLVKRISTIHNDFRYRQDAPQAAAKVAAALQSVPEKVRDELRSQPLYLECGVSRSSKGPGHFSINIDEDQKHITDFLLRAFVGTQAAEKPADISRLLTEKSELEEFLFQLRGNNLPNLKLDTSAAGDFSEIRKAVPRLPGLIQQLPPAEQEVLQNLTLLLVGKDQKNSGSSNGFALSITRPDAEIVSALHDYLSPYAFVRAISKELGKKYNLRTAGGYLKGRTDARDLATKIRTAIEGLPVPMQDKLGEYNIYLEEGKFPPSSDGHLNVNVDRSVEQCTEDMRAFLAPRLSQAVVDNKYNKEGKTEDVNVNADLAKVVQQQKNFLLKKAAKGFVTKQDFPPEALRALQKAVAAPPQGITVSDVEPKEKKPALKPAQLTIDGQKWCMVSDIVHDKEEGCALEIYLYRQDKPDVGILLPAEAFFKADDTLDGDRLRRFAGLADIHASSEEKDEANVKEFDIARKNTEAQKGEGVGHIILIDRSDKLIKQTESGARALPAALKKSGYNIDKANIVDIEKGVNPLREARRQIVALTQKGLPVITLDLVSHGGGHAAAFAGGNLDAEQLLDLTKEFPNTRFVIFAEQCYGAGMEDAIAHFDDVSPAAGRVSILLAGKATATTVAEKSRGEAEYTAAYRARMLVALSDPKNSGVPIGQLHLDADAAAKKETFRNAGFWRSGGKGKPSLNTARIDGRDRDPAI